MRRRRGLEESLLPLSPMMTHQQRDASHDQPYPHFSPVHLVHDPVLKEEEAEEEEEEEEEEEGGGGGGGGGGEEEEDNVRPT